MKQTEMHFMQTFNTAPRGKIKTLLYRTKAGKSQRTYESKIDWSSTLLFDALETVAEIRSFFHTTKTLSF